MTVFLIRHTTPRVPVGLCYGQTDLRLEATFGTEAEAVRARIKAEPSPSLRIYSSPLSRCLRLAGRLWPEASIATADALMELDFGAWENRPWADLAGPDLDRWMQDFVHATVPGGESYQTLYERCSRWWEETIEGGANGGETIEGRANGGETIGEHAKGEVAVVTHAGVIRSLLCHCSGTALADSFRSYTVPYGSVYLLSKENGPWTIRLL